ncbi:hypothetical protein [Amycolatopsis arida]|uniref:hypothetical protein n=1 Tax=Amycolatopsis arida TaxID=587909 RepID=UPI00106492FB|nr:hypothetical protein [Amycolatopsis arida]
MNELSSAGRDETGGWAGPPAGEAALNVRPANQVLAQSAQASVTVLELRKYTHGYAIEVEATATTESDEPGELIRSSMAEHRGTPPAVLRFIVQLSDGRSASTLDHQLVPSLPPAPPYLASLGGPGYHVTGKQLSSRQSLWLWPTVESAHFKLMAEWPLFGLSASGISVDGSTLATQR